MRLPFAFGLLMLPSLAFAGDLKIEKAMVPMAPPGVMAHAAFMTITNDGDVTRSLVGAAAEGYKMAHIHETSVKDGIATMSSVDLVEIAPGQSVTFEHGGLHVMLMKPAGAAKMGDVIALTLEFANGEVVPVTAKVAHMKHHGHGS